MWNRKKFGALMAASMLAGGIGSQLIVGGAAQATPGAQAKCTGNVWGTSITSDQGWQPLNVGVTINNGTSVRNVIAQFSADMGVDEAAEVRLGYSVDGGPVQEKVYGPGNFANHDEFWETGSTIAVIRMPAGTHTVQPYWRVSGASGKTAYLEFACFTVEGRTM